MCKEENEMITYSNEISTERYNSYIDLLSDGVGMDHNLTKDNQ